MGLPIISPQSSRRDREPESRCFQQTVRVSPEFRSQGEEARVFHGCPCGSELIIISLKVYDVVHSGKNLSRIKSRAVQHGHTGGQSSACLRGIRTCERCVLSRAIPFSELAQQRHKIIRKGLALLRDESVSVVTVGTAPAPTGDPSWSRSLFTHLLGRAM
jgi:hypothetical protein